VAAPASGAEWQRRAFVYLFFSEEELELGLEARLGKQHSKHASDDRI